MKTQIPHPFLLLVAGLLLVLRAGPGAAQEAKLTPVWPTCMPPRDNVAVKATVVPPMGWATVRVYFRAGGTLNFYFLEMRNLGNGNYEAVLPKPEADTKVVEMYILARDAQGKETKLAPVTVNVSPTCKGELSNEERKWGENLVVGETAKEQRNKEVTGFLCDGIVSRITWENKLVPDEVCRKAIAAKEDHRKILVPLVLAGAGGGVTAIIRHEGKKEASPSRP